jgi:hypothetical protein
MYNQITINKPKASPVFRVIWYGPISQFGGSWTFIDQGQAEAFYAQPIPIGYSAELFIERSDTDYTRLARRQSGQVRFPDRTGEPMA